MPQVQFADLTSGYERFDALRKNLEGIFEKVYQMREYKLNISYYEDKLEQIKEKFHLADTFLKCSIITYEDIKKTYEDFTLGEINKALEDLTIEFEQNVAPIYNIYTYFNAIEDKINEGNASNIDGVVTQTILLIDQINNINTHNIKEVTRLFDKAYEVIFSALLYEKVYDRQDILNYLRSKNLSTNRENLGKILRKEVYELIRKGQLSTSDVDEEFLAHIHEGLGYDFLSDEFLGKLSKIVLADKYDDINNARLQAKDEMTGAIKRYNRNYISMVYKLKGAKERENDLRKVRAGIASTACAIILVPFLALGAGALAGKVSSDKVDMWSTVTRSVNMETGEIVYGPTKTYNERSTTYVATITIYGPWRKNPTGVGYIRDAVAYEFSVPADAGEDYHVTKEDIEGNLKEKYRFSQVKDKLDENNSMTDSEIIVTETYQDKSDSQKSTKYIIPFALLSFFLTSILEGLLLYKANFSLRDFLYERYEACLYLKNAKDARKGVEKELAKYRKDAERIIAEKKQLEASQGIYIDVDVDVLREAKKEAVSLLRH